MPIKDEQKRTRCRHLNFIHSIWHAKEEHSPWSVCTAKCWVTSTGLIEEKIDRESHATYRSVSRSSSHTSLIDWSTYFLKSTGMTSGLLCAAVSMDTEPGFWKCVFMFVRLFRRKLLIDLLLKLLMKTGQPVLQFAVQAPSGDENRPAALRKKGK